MSPEQLIFNSWSKKAQELFITYGQLIPKELERISKKKQPFKKPTIGEAREFFVTKHKLRLCEAQKRAEAFILFYESKGWKVGKSNMKNWRSAATRSLQWEMKDDRKFIEKAESNIKSTTQGVINLF